MRPSSPEGGLAVPGSSAPSLSKADLGTQPSCPLPPAAGTQKLRLTPHFQSSLSSVTKWPESGPCQPPHARSSSPDSLPSRYHCSSGMSTHPYSSPLSPLVFCPTPHSGPVLRRPLHPSCHQRLDSMPTALALTLRVPSGSASVWALVLCLLWTPSL